MRRRNVQKKETKIKIGSKSEEDKYEVLNSPGLIKAPERVHVTLSPTQRSNNHHLSIDKTSSESFSPHFN